LIDSFIDNSVSDVPEFMNESTFSLFSKQNLNVNTTTPVKDEIQKEVA